ncbi:MAG: hypothetical protein EOO16_08565 [Chitinophagaceae bacterium]|nr:MAG: hypothetical protein EOO16_08565 [Chitinophagaceae bacterium]
MKIFKYSALALLAAFSLSSCLKAKNDFGGTLEDEGTIVTSIYEQNYQKNARANLGLTYRIAANFSFATPNEAVRFFNLQISQPRETKLSGPMTVNFQMTALPLTTVLSPVNGAGLPAALPAAGTTVALPAAAVSIQPITVQPSDAPDFRVPVIFNVDKSQLVPGTRYGARFYITSASQGVVAKYDSYIDVYINFGATYNTSRYTGRYVGTTTIRDSLGFFNITNDTKQFRIFEGDPFGAGFMANIITPVARYSSQYSLSAVDTRTGGYTHELAGNYYVLDAAGKVIDVQDAYNGGASLNPVFDNSAPNAFVITNNYTRVLHVKYRVRLDPEANGQLRAFDVEERFVYDEIQAF